MPIATEEQARQYQVMDPSLLGRPVHLLPQFAQRLGEDLAAALQSAGWRRYWGGYRLDSVEFGQAPAGAQLRWLGAPALGSVVAAAFERQLLLGLLDWRYGRRSGPAPARDPAAERVTATEERLSVVLTQQLVALLAGRVAAEVATEAAPVGPAAPVAAPPGSAWTIRITLRAAQSDEAGQCFLALDNELMGRIMHALQPVRPRPARAAAQPLGGALQVRLDGRLVSKEIALATLFELKVGDVIPVSVGRAEVLLDESRLFTAAVAEHKGKLCLTSFEDAE